MSHVSMSAEPRRVPLLLPHLLTTLNALGVEFRRRRDTLSLRGADVLSAELRADIVDHKAVLLMLCDMRTGSIRLGEYAIWLRCENPPNGTREAALAWLSQQIKNLAAASLAFGGTGEGWPDGSDAFADMDQITTLRHDMAELTLADAPYPVPLPPGCQLLPQANFDPFAHGRYYSGKLIGAP